jgi:quercetin dioxygenase-like cupin family protein
MAQRSDGIDNNGGTTRRFEAAEVLLPSKGIAADLEFWTSEDLGFRMDQIYPADNPQVAALSGHGLRLRLDAAATSAPGAIRLLCNDTENAFNGQRELTSPSGTRVEIVPASNPFPKPPTSHTFQVRRLKDNAPWVIGRAGMHYRDLIPGRLGGAIIASHIRIPDAGPVPDRVHFHDIGFQLIFCIHGWVRLVYEDQGPPFVLRAGDCVTQPPRIRHRVLEASEGLQVVEIGVPAEHMTTVDHGMELPNTKERVPDREWEGQRFVHSLKDEAVWQAWRVPGFEARDTGIGEGTKGVASVHVVRPVTGAEGQGAVTSHGADILFTFVLSGTCTLHAQDQSSYQLADGDAFTVPPGYKSSLADCSPGLTLLEVSLPAEFETKMYTNEKLL